VSFYLNTKICISCGTELDRNMFDIAKHNKDGRNNECKNCRKENHKEIIAEKAKKYYENHKEAIVKRKKKYYKNNKEILIEKSKKYRETHKEAIAKRKKIYYETHKKLKNINNFTSIFNIKLLP
jgi:esterase/lipase